MGKKEGCEENLEFGHLKAIYHPPPSGQNKLTTLMFVNKIYEFLENTLDIWKLSFWWVILTYIVTLLQPPMSRRSALSSLTIVSSSW